MKQTLQWLSAFKMSSHISARGKSARMLMAGHIRPRYCKQEFSLNNIYHHRSEIRTKVMDCIPFLLGVGNAPWNRLSVNCTWLLIPTSLFGSWVKYWVKYYRENSGLNREGYSLAMVFRKDNFSDQYSSTLFPHSLLFEGKELLAGKSCQNLYGGILMISGVITKVSVLWVGSHWHTKVIENKL